MKNQGAKKFLALSFSLTITASLLGCNQVIDKNVNIDEVTGRATENQTVSQTEIKDAFEDSVDVIKFGTSVTEATTQPIQLTEPAVTLSDDELCAIDADKHGYGQGYEVDEYNRSVGAIMFNDEYSEYGGYAIDLADSSQGKLFLTFDQGYENGFTAPILDTLKEKNVKAVFFLTGDYSKRNKDLVQRMIDEGHTLGNHGMKHASIPELSATSIQCAEDEILSLHNYVLENYNYEMYYFRPPCGEFSKRSIALAERLGYKTMLWSFAYADWDVNNQPDLTTAFDRVSGAAHGGGIYLLHSVSETNATILPQVIDSIREQGFELTVPEI